MHIWVKSGGDIWLLTALQRQRYPLYVGIVGICIRIFLHFSYAVLYLVLRNAA